MTLNYTLEDVDTRYYKVVAIEVLSLHQRCFPDADGSYIIPLFDDIQGMFAGEYKNYQAMDTIYHDLEHTLQATLCWVRLMANRHLINIEPVITAKEFQIGLTAILFHDIGYLKEKGDRDGTGAKYTFVHERRSCEIVDIYLSENKWDKYDMFAVQHLIGCTGPRSIINAIPFHSKAERMMGEAVCTADYVGQMSDYNYVKKLPALFLEFEESDDFREVPKEERLFKSKEELLTGTPYFWEEVVVQKLENECHGLLYCLSDPYPDGNNPYINKIEENVNLVREICASNGSKTVTDQE